MSFSHLSIDEFSAMRRREERLTVLDIRDPHAYAAGHIDAAIHLTQQNVETVLDSLSVPEPVVVCCYHGHSSQPVAQWLADRGFERVYSLDGGYTEWAQVNT